MTAILFAGTTNRFLPSRRLQRKSSSEMCTLCILYTFVHILNIVHIWHIVHIVHVVHIVHILHNEHILHICAHVNMCTILRSDATFLKRQNPFPRHPVISCTL